MKQATTRPPRFARTALVVILILVAQPFQLAGLGRPLIVFQGSALVVNSIGDQPDSTVGDDRCDTDGNAANGDQCTLRAAIQEANPTPANVDPNFSPRGQVNCYPVLGKEARSLTIVRSC